MSWQHYAYLFFKPFLRVIDPEEAHLLSLEALSVFCKQPTPPLENNPLERNGIFFRNRVGLAAGFDKDGKYIDALSSMGFGFIEVGTVTPKPQIGHEKPRLFRSFSEQTIVNHMGFNNDGVEKLALRLENCLYRKLGGIVGVNIGKNASTPMGWAYCDYLTCIDRIYSLCDYITVNISSPNTSSLRSLQEHKELEDLLPRIKEKQQEMKKITNTHTPIFVKFSPDLSFSNIEEICKVILQEEVEGIILTNTTTDRPIRNRRLQREFGGLSGFPLKNKSDQTLGVFRKCLGGSDITIIGTGGICSKQDAQDKFDKGANLVQLYSGLVFKGPSLVTDCVMNTKNL